jgi:hypothetical protein
LGRGSVESRAFAYFAGAHFRAPLNKYVVGGASLMRFLDPERSIDKRLISRRWPAGGSVRIYKAAFQPGPVKCNQERSLSRFAAPS